MGALIDVDRLNLDQVIYNEKVIYTCARIDCRAFPADRPVEALKGFGHVGWHGSLCWAKRALVAGNRAREKRFFKAAEASETGAVNDLTPRLDLSLKFKRFPCILYLVLA